MALTGGLRDRMILESVMQEISSYLFAKGWDNTGMYSPISYIVGFPDDEATPDINTIAFSFGESFEFDLEMGSKAEEHNWPIFVDMFAESNALGLHVIGDMYEYVKKQVSFPIYDYEQATPPIDFYAILKSNATRKQPPLSATRPWQKHWVGMVFTLTDERANT